MLEPPITYDSGCMLVGARARLLMCAHIPVNQWETYFCGLLHLGAEMLTHCLTKSLWTIIGIK